MAFTKNADKVFVEYSGSYAAQGGDDTYILSKFMLKGGSTIDIIDQQGNNKIQLLGGLEIISSKVTHDTAQLIISKAGEDNITVNITGADNFGYILAGNPSMGEASPKAELDYADFGTTVIGRTIPAAPAAGAPVVVVDGGKADVDDAGEVDVLPPVGGSTNNVAITNGTSGATGVEENFVWTQSSAVGHSTLTNFGITEDSIQFDLAGTEQLTTTLDKLNGHSLSGEGMISVSLNQFTQETVIGLGNDSQGQPLALTLVGVSDASQVDVSVI